MLHLSYVSQMIKGWDFECRSPRVRPDLPRKPRNPQIPALADL